MARVTRLVNGSPEWPSKQYATIWEECHEADVLVLGTDADWATAGANLWARRFAEFYQRPYILYTADWKKRRGSAVKHRNTAMVRHLVKAQASKGFGTLGTFDARVFYVPWAKNIGTRDCHGKCVKDGFDTIRIDAK